MFSSRLMVCTLVCVMAQHSFSAVLNIDPKSVAAQAWVVYDTQTQQVIAEHNSHVKRAPASLTKMMVAYIVLKDIQAGKLQKNQTIQIKELVNQVQDDESQMELIAGEQVSIDQLLAGLIIMSANDAALTLADVVGEGNTEQFIQRMNQEAQILGMNNTSFANPSGITMEQHYSTAYDLTLLSQALIAQTPDYLNYSKQLSFNYKKPYEATNILLEQDSRIDGLKTGYTNAAGYSLALTAMQKTGVPFTPPTTQTSPPTTTVQKPVVNTQSTVTTTTPTPTIGRTPQQDRRLIVIVLGTDNKVQRADVSYKLLNLAFEYTDNIQLIKKQTKLTEVAIQYGNKKSLTIYAPQNYQFTASLYPQNTPIDLTQFNRQTFRLAHNVNHQPQTIEPLTQATLSYEVTPSDTLIAPLKQANIKVAQIKIMQNQNMIHEFSLQQDVDLKPMSWWQKSMLWIENFFKSIIPA